MNRAPLGPQETAVPSSAKPRQRIKLTTIPIDTNYRLAADGNAWMIQRRKRRKSRHGDHMTGDWETFSWHPTLEEAVNALASYALRTSGAQSVAEALAEVERISATLVRALSPRFEVKEVA